jgi:hypothetical protein
MPIFGNHNTRQWGLGSRPFARVARYYSWPIKMRSDVQTPETP